VNAPTIGQALRAYRERNNIKQEEIAKRLGVSQSAISLWEADQVKPTKKYRLRIEALIQQGSERTTSGSLIRFVNGSPNTLVLADDDFAVIARSNSWADWQFSDLLQFSDFQEYVSQMSDDAKKNHFRGAIASLRFKSRLLTFGYSKIFNSSHAFNIGELVSIVEDRSNGSNIVAAYHPEFDDNYD
jgi:transcriptional regulator with XRE-family HTH domain